jgi:hypothetical protein
MLKDLKERRGQVAVVHTASPAVCQLCQQRLGLLEIGGVKALGEPAIDRCEQRIGFGVRAPAAATGGSGS